jgi:tRNA (cmo5U34)-methyltransferase
MSRPDRPTRPDVWDAATYDVPRRRLIPEFDRFYGAAATLVAATVGARPRILDLGAGTGILSDAVRAAVPGARFVLLDGSADMLGVARARLDRSVERIAVQDLTEALPDGPFDAVVSALAIHHLADVDKRSLFRRILDRLLAGGIFVNADQALGSTAALERAFALEHETGARALGASDDEWSAALERMSHDRAATLADQLTWLRDAGFEDVAVAFVGRRFVVYSGRRSG